MRLRLMSLLVILSIFVSYSNAQETIQKKYCMSSIGYQGTSDELRAELLMEAKRLAVGEFFGEFISSYTKVELFTLTEDRIVASSAGFVRIKGSPVFESGDSFGDVCVSIDAYVTKEDLDKFKPINITKKHCVSDPNLTASQIKKHAKKQAIITALVDYDRKLESRNKENLLPLVHNIKYLESGFIAGTESYCVKFEGVIYPIEILALGAEPISKVDKTLEEKITEKEIKKPVKEKVSGAGKIFYKEDFSKVEEGMIPYSWIGGETVMVSSDERNTFLTQFEGSNHSFTVEDINFPNNFRLEWMINCDKYVWYKIVIGSVTVQIERQQISMNKTRKNMPDNWHAGKTIKFSLEKIGPVFKLYVNQKKELVSRYPNFESPLGFTFEIGGGFKLYEIVGTDLGE